MRLIELQRSGIVRLIESYGLNKLLYDKVLTMSGYKMQGFEIARNMANSQPTFNGFIDLDELQSQLYKKVEKLSGHRRKGFEMAIRMISK